MNNRLCVLRESSITYAPTKNRLCVLRESSITYAPTKNRLCVLRESSITCAPAKNRLCVLREHSLIMFVYPLYALVERFDCNYISPFILRVTRFLE